MLRQPALCLVLTALAAPPPDPGPDTPEGVTRRLARVEGWLLAPDGETLIL